MKKEVIRHLKGDIKTFKQEAAEDKALIKKLKSKKHEKKESKSHEKKERVAKKAVKKKAVRKKMHADAKREKKIAKVMREFDAGVLHSGSKKGPKVKSRRQAIAIALSEARKAAK